MGLPNEVNSALIGAAAAGGYEIEQSLRFDGSGPSRLTYDNTSGTNNSSSAWTLSFWMKRGSDINTSQYGNDLHLMMWTPSGSCANTEYFLVADPNHGTTAIQNCMSFNGGGYSGNVANKQRDPSAWYHFVWRGNTGSSTNIIYINGVPVTDYNQGPSSMTSSYVNGASRWSIGDSYTGCGSSPWDGYLAEVHFVDGQTLDHEDFGEFDDNGVWRPIKYTGTYGTNGYYLKFDPSATNGVGHDHSGNGHHWTASNVTTSGAGTDVLSDTPTNNFPTFNPLALDRGLVNGNLDIATGHGNGDFVWTHTQAVSERSGGNWYWEYTLSSVQNTSDFYFGVVEYTDPIHRWPDWSYGVLDKLLAFNTASTNTQWRIRNDNTVASNAPSGGMTVSANDVIGVRLDIDNDLITLSKNGTVQTGISGVLSTDPSAYYVPATNFYGNNDGGSFNAGQRPFSHQPSGTSALCTANLPAADIKDPGKNFNVVTYTGNGSTQSITGVGFQPDFVWVKKYNSSGGHHTLTDAVRGTNKQLWSNRTEGEQTSSLFITSFDSDGFSVGNSSVGYGNVNTNNDTFVAFCWKAGNGTSSNTAGSTSSTVSANPTAGFSIVGFNPTAYDTATTVGHGLGVAPDFIIVKSRDSNANWDVYHSSVGASQKGVLNDTGTFSNSGAWGSTAPTSTVFTFNPGGQNNNNHIAYCFAEVEGYNRFGSYTGNGDANGPFIYCGFRPAWVLVRKISGNDWDIRDSARDTYNPADHYMFTNSTTVGNDNLIDLLSNGFKVRTTSATWNTSTSEYIFVAFAENSFGGENVSPATAR